MDCSPDSLLKASACYDGIRGSYSDAAIIYLLNQLAKTGLSPSQLAEAARCYCFDKKSADAVITYLLCQIANAGGTGGGLVWGPNATVIDAMYFDALSFPATITTLTFPTLTTITNYFKVAGGIITTLNFPELVTIGPGFATGIDVLGAAQVTSFSCPKLVPGNGILVRVQNCKLDLASVELILRRFALVPSVTGCFVLLAGGTNAGIAMLSPQGLADYNAVAVNNNVFLNP